MNPQNLSQQEYVAYPCPTSPWTDCFQDAPSHQAERAAFDGDDQRPDETRFDIRDALSDFYNRDYQ